MLVLSYIKMSLCLSRVSLSYIDLCYISYGSWLSRGFYGRLLRRRRESFSNNHVPYTHATSGYRILVLAVDMQYGAWTVD